MGAWQFTYTLGPPKNGGELCLTLATPIHAAPIRCAVSISKGPAARGRCGHGWRRSSPLSWSSGWSSDIVGPIRRATSPTSLRRLVRPHRHRDLRRRPSRVTCLHLQHRRLQRRRPRHRRPPPISDRADVSSSGENAAAGVSGDRVVISLGGSTGACAAFHTGKLSCLRAGISTFLPRSIPNARASRLRVARGMITSSI